MNSAVALLRCFSLHALVADLVVVQEDQVVVQGDYFYGLVDTNRVGEGLQSWHEAGQVDSRLVGVSLQLC